MYFQILKAAYGFAVRDIETKIALGDQSYVAHERQMSEIADECVCYARMFGGVEHASYRGEVALEDYGG